jgi:hypothetical protein
MLVAGELGLQTPQMAVGALIEISGGLLLALPLALVLGLIAEATLAAGGFIGGTIVFVYGNRVLRPDAPIGDALIPGRSEPEEVPVSPPTGRRARG